MACQYADSCYFDAAGSADETSESSGIGPKNPYVKPCFAPKEYQAFAAVAENLSVSKSALSIRLEQLGLLARNDLKDPYALVRIEADEEELF